MATTYLHFLALSTVALLSLLLLIFRRTSVEFISDEQGFFARKLVDLHKNVYKTTTATASTTSTTIKNKKIGIKSDSDGGVIINSISNNSNGFFHERRHLETSEAAQDKPSSPAIYFLFSLRDRLLNEAIWREFFTRIPQNYVGKYRLFIHFSDRSDSGASFLEKIAVVIKTLPNSHKYDEQLYQLEIMLHLLGTSLKESKNRGDMFIFIGEKTIPTKGFHDMADYFLPIETTIGAGISLNVENRTSSLCFMDPNKWEILKVKDIDVDKNITTERNVTAPLVQRWVALTREHAAKAINVYEKHQIKNKESPLTQVFYDKDNNPLFPDLIARNSLRPLDIINYWFYLALFDVPLAQTNSTLVASLNLYLDATSNIEQGKCHTYTFSRGYHPASPFYKIRSVFIKTLPENSDNIMNPSLQFLDDLHDSKEFFFVCCFDSHHHKFYVRHQGGEKMTLMEGYSRLGIFTTPPGQHHNHEAVLQSKYAFNKTSIFEMINPEDYKFHRGNSKGDNGGLKVLVVTIDNRDLKDNRDSGDYLSYASVLLFNWCKLHGYDFLKFTPDAAHLAAKANMKYNLGLKNSLHDKYGMSVFHSGLKVGRASSWTKLPVLWYLIALMGEHYDYFMFMDSDASISPVSSKISLFDRLQMWNNDSSKILRGNKEVMKSNFIFLSNFPWRDDLPCAGIMILKPNSDTEALVREWWDYDIPSKNYYDFMEQDALWYQLEAEPSYGLKLNFSVATLVDEKAFPSAWYGVSTLWTIHIANYDPNRAVLFKNMLKMSGLWDHKIFEAEVAEIYRKHYLQVDIFEITEAMEDFNQHLRDIKVQGPRKPASALPPCRSGKNDDRWHWATRPKDPPRPPPGELWNGIPIAVTPFRSIWLVYNNTRYEFGSMDMFTARGYDTDFVVHFRTRDAENSIPIHTNQSVTPLFPPIVQYYKNPIIHTP